MQIIREHFGLLFTTDCRYSRPKIIGDTLRICVKDVGLMEGHPARTTPGSALIYVPRCHFKFDGVSSSVRTLSPYIGNPKLGKFGQRYEEHDGPFSPKGTAKEYGFEGMLEDPAAWMDWVVKAESFTLEILSEAVGPPVNDQPGSRRKSGALAPGGVDDTSPHVGSYIATLVAV